jgi:hypothetical protein
MGRCTGCLATVPSLPQVFEGIKGMGREAGRDPAALELSVRANVAFSEAALGEARADFNRVV